MASGIFLDNNDEDCDKSSKKYKSSQAIHKYSPKMAKESHDISKDSKRPKTNQQLSHTHQLEYVDLFFFLKKLGPKIWVATKSVTTKKGRMRYIQTNFS